MTIDINNFFIEHNIIINIFLTCIVISVGFFQFLLSKKQNKIQKDGIKIALLQERLNCLHVINNARSELLHRHGVASYLDGMLDSNATNKFFTRMTDMHIQFMKTVLLSKYLFNEKIYSKLTEISITFTQYKEKMSLFMLQMLKEIEDFKKNPQNISPYIEFAIRISQNPKLISNNEQITKDLLNCFGDLGKETHELFLILKQFALDDSFFALFDEYINVKDLGK